MSTVEITAEWHPSTRSGRAVQVYYVNGYRCSTYIRDVVKVIRAMSPVPTKFIKKACLQAKATECCWRIYYTAMTGWRAYQKQ